MTTLLSNFCKGPAQVLAQREAQRGQEDAVLLGAKLNLTFRGVAVWSSVTAVFGFRRVKSKTEMPQHDTENNMLCRELATAI